MQELPHSDSFMNHWSRVLLYPCSGQTVHPPTTTCLHPKVLDSQPGISPSQLALSADCVLSQADFKDMAYFFDPAADPFALFREGPTLSHQALQTNPNSLPAAADVGSKDERLEELYAGLNYLTLQAEEIVARQPRATQVKLMLETKGLFNAYKHFGSMVRLERGVEKFLKAGDRGGRLTFKATPKQGSKGIATPSNEQPAHYGKAFMHNYTADDDKYEHPVCSDMGVPLTGSQMRHPLRIVDPDSLSYVTTLPWDPVGTEVRWPAALQLPKGLLGKINQVLSLADHECRVRLFHHVSKYGPSPILRAGIEAQAQTHYSSIFEDRAHNYLGLTPETRVFLRHVFEKKPTVNIAESRLLARVCRIADETVDLLWEDLAASRKAHRAMKVFITAREIEKGRQYKRREQKDFLQQQREKIFRDKEILKRQELEQDANKRPKNTAPGFLNNSGPMSGGMSRGERLRVDPDLQRGSGPKA
jgi:hypothetical protein